jgi:hypothetical protein
LPAVSLTPFHVVGAILALWAIAVSVVGMRSASFPGSPRTERLVMGVSALLVAATIGAAIYSSIAKEGAQAAVHAAHTVA